MPASPSKPQNRSAARVSPPPAHQDADKAASKAPDPAPTEVAAAEPLNLTGWSEHDVRALLGPPTTEENNAPGKTWRYRDGQCSLDVQLYPDVKTHQYGTLDYEVKSDDNTSEGKRFCMGQFQSRSQSKRE
jgi:hypothetical protein